MLCLKWCKSYVSLTTNFNSISYARESRTDATITSQRLMQFSYKFLLKITNGTTVTERPCMALRDWTSAFLPYTLIQIWFCTEPLQGVKVSSLFCLHCHSLQWYIYKRWWSMLSYISTYRKLNEYIGVKCVERCTFHMWERGFMCTSRYKYNSSNYFCVKINCLAWGECWMSNEFPLPFLQKSEKLLIILLKLSEIINNCHYQ